MDKIDVQKLADEGVPMMAALKLAVKLNEIIDKLNAWENGSKEGRITPV